MTLSLAAINSLTKYPSILTYHKLGAKGRLTEELNVDFDGDVIVTEKIDGTNCRVIVVGDQVFDKASLFVGSREELLYAHGDVVHNPSMYIVETVKPILSRLPACPSDKIRVYYFEAYGFRIGTHAKEYAAKGERDLRLFDVADIDALKFESATLDEIARQRDAGGPTFQSFLSEEELQEVSGSLLLKLAPRREQSNSGVPKSVHDAFGWLYAYRHTEARIEPRGEGFSEGVVVRTHDRKKIAKLRFEDYSKTI